MRKLRHEEIRRPDPAEAALLPKHPISIVVDNVRSIYNVGSIFRTSDAALIEHVYLTGISGTPDHPAVHKTALGAQDMVPWSHEKSPVDVVSRLKQRGYEIAILEITDEPTAATDIAVDQFPLCLVLGNELHGVDDSIVDLADLALEIPQYGAKQSLNVSVAYGIAVFDLVRRFRKLHDLSAAPDWSADANWSDTVKWSDNAKRSIDAVHAVDGAGVSHDEESTSTCEPPTPMRDE